MWVEGDIASGRSAWQGMAWCGCAGLLVSCSWGEIWMAASSWGEVGSAFLALEDVASWYVSYVASWYVSLVWVGLLGRLLGPLLGLWPFECGDFLVGIEASSLSFAPRSFSVGRRHGVRGVCVSSMWRRSAETCSFGASGPSRGCLSWVAFRGLARWGPVEWLLAKCTCALVTRRSGEGTVGWLPVHVGGCVAGILLTVSWGRRALWGLVAWEAEWCGRGLRGGLL